MYLVYESNYGELQCECDATSIIGLYKTKDEALEIVKREVENNKEYDFVLDNEDIDSSIEKRGCLTMFYKYQENWNSYFEIIIKEINVSGGVDYDNKD